MINKKKNSSSGFRRFFSSVSFFLHQSGSFWRWLASGVGLIVFILLLHYVVSVYVYGGSIFGKHVEGAKIRSIKVRTGSTISQEQLLETLNLKLGMPFYDRDGKSFTGDLTRKVNEIMRNAPTIASLEITRQPSNSISIVVTERVPVARLSGAPLAVDPTGVIFVNRSNDRVPDFIGFPRSIMIPGKKLDVSKKNHMAALELVNYMNEINGNVNGLVFSLTSVDISNAYRLACVFNGGINVDLAWQGMGEGNPDALKMLQIQLETLSRTLSHPQSSGGRRYILTHPNKCFMR